MKTFPWTKSLLLVLFVLLCLNYFSGISSVPFHPDESTQIYTSSDVSQWFQNPLSLAYSKSTSVDDRMRYRLIDSPVTRTLIGSGLLIFGLNPVQMDWDWSKSWAENSQAGALPAINVLHTARWSVAWMFPFSLLFLFLITKKLGGWGAGILSVLLLSTNALILIHTRRAMAESALVCLLCASVWCLLFLDKRIWITALPIGLAINSKQITFPLVGVGFFDIFLRPGDRLIKHNRLLQAGIFIAGVLIISSLLNPVYWKSPLSAFQAGIDYRTDLSDRMNTDYQSKFRFMEQSATLIGQVFIEPPAVADVGNYLYDTQTQEEAYFRNPISNLFRGYTGGAVFLGFTIFGWIILIRRLLTRQEPNRYPAGIFLLITSILILTIMIFTPVHFQRYYISLVPLFITSQSIALNSILTTAYIRIKKGRPDMAA